MDIQNKLKLTHSYLMRKGFPYNKISVIHRHQDLGFHVIFNASVKEMVTDEVKDILKDNGFGFSFVSTN